MQLRCTAYHVFQSRRGVDHFIAIAFCKANTRTRGCRPSIINTFPRDIMADAGPSGTAQARKEKARALPSARSKRDFVPQFAPQCSDDVESSRRFRLYRTRNRRTRERRSLSSVHAPHDGGQARCRAAVARRDERLRQGCCAIPFFYYFCLGPTTFRTNASNRGSPRSGSSQGSTLIMSMFGLSWSAITCSNQRTASSRFPRLR